MTTSCNCPISPMSNCPMLRGALMRRVHFHFLRPLFIKTETLPPESLLEIFKLSIHVEKIRLGYRNILDELFGVQVLVSVVLVHQHITSVIKTNILAVVKKICKPFNIVLACPINVLGPVLLLILLCRLYPDFGNYVRLHFGWLEKMIGVFREQEMMSKRVLWIIYSGALSFESNFSAFQAVECL